MYWNSATIATISGWFGLIETWDVLKLWREKIGMLKYTRLIETWDVLKQFSNDLPVVSDSINRNMRCIEISETGDYCADEIRLIETWDVLKFSLRFCHFRLLLRLIETWDVLKSVVEIPCAAFPKINRNMRCIEIMKPESQ